ncbi:MAG: three component ABC system middle component [Gemmatales bacterium]
MKSWPERPTEVGNNFNPAFCGWLLREAVEGYCSVKSEGLPFVLSFLVLPIILHRPTRDLLPRSTATALHPWLREHPEARIGLAERSEQLATITRESILFLSTHGLISITDAADIRAEGKLERGKAPILAASEEVKACVSRAKMVGAWFASAGDAVTVYQMWGVRP